MQDIGLPFEVRRRYAGASGCVPVASSPQVRFIRYLSVILLLCCSLKAVADLRSAIDAYERGDYAAAYEGYRFSAEVGNAAAQSALGVMYRDGQGIPQDYAEAMKWFRLAVEQGDAVAQFNLGVMYQEGQGVPQNYHEALKWYRLAAEQGFAAAQSNLGFMYSEGRGVPQDYAEALKWSRLAAEQGFARAQYNLGIMYAEGTGVNADLIQTYAWCGVSAAGGFSQAVQCYQAAEQRLSPDERAKARQLTVDFREKYMGQ